MCTTGEARCSEGNRYVCSNDVWYQQNCAIGTVCSGAGQCVQDTSVCQPGHAICSGESRLVCVSGLYYVTQNCAFGSVCVGEGQCTGGAGCEGGVARCSANNERELCSNGTFYPSPCAPGTVCSGAGECIAPPPVISQLVVNDKTNGGDNIRNDTQWSIEAFFSGGNGERPFGDRTYTIATIPPGAKHLIGNVWIVTAADSKTYNGSLPLATATLHGRNVYLAVDRRHGTTFTTSLSNAGYTKETYSITVNEGATPRPYDIWIKPITPGVSFTFPKVNSGTAPCYFVIVED